MYKDYRGAQVTIQYGDSATGNATGNGSDDAEYRGDLLFGVGNDTTSITGDIFYYKHHDMFNHDRQNSLTPPFLSSNAVPWNLQLQTAAVVAAGVVLLPVMASRRTICVTPPDNSNGVT